MCIYGGVSDGRSHNTRERSLRGEKEVLRKWMGKVIEYKRIESRRGNMGRGRTQVGRELEGERRGSTKMKCEWKRHKETSSFVY